MIKTTEEILDELKRLDRGYELADSLKAEERADCKRIDWKRVRWKKI